MGITATEVNKLRQQTGAGLMDCKKALVEAEGDFEQAIDYLRKKGQKISANRADREAKEGAVIAKTDDANREGVIVYLSCETDFVAKNDDFVSFANAIADKALAGDIINKESLLGVEFDGLPLQEKINEQVGKIGEKIEISAYERMEGEAVVGYIHAGNKIGVLVSFNKNSEAVKEIGRDIAMQIAAMNPISVTKDDISQSVIDRELEIAKEQVRAEGKPENMVEKIALGKLNKFYKESTLENQQFVKDSSKSVADVLKEVDKELKVTAFKRVSIG